MIIILGVSILLYTVGIKQYCRSGTSNWKELVLSVLQDRVPRGQAPSVCVSAI